MSTFKILPKTTIRIADLKDKTKEDLARRYDVGNKGYLTTTEAYALYADNNKDLQPSNLADVVTFLGGAQHTMAQHHLDGSEVLGLPWHLHDWKGDFNIPGFGAGNVRVGGYYNWERPDDPRAAGFLIDLNLVDKGKVENDILSATIVVGPTGFTPEANSRLPEEAVEIPLALATQDAHSSWTRTGTSHVPERKFLAATVDLDDLRKLGNDKDGVSFYVRLETTSGTKWINRDGVPGQNFDISDAELKRYGGI
jgi:hypothetical protein